MTYRRVWQQRLFCPFIVVKFALYCKLSYHPHNVFLVLHCREFVYSFILMYIILMYFFLFATIPSTTTLMYDYVVFISYGCRYNIPQTEWLRPAELYWLSVPETRCPNSRCWQGHSPFEGARKGCGPSLYPHSGSCRGSLACRFITPVFYPHVVSSPCLHTIFPACMSFSVSKISPLYKNTSRIELGLTITTSF